MKIILSILFLGWIVFMALAQSAKVFKKYNLYDRSIDDLKMGFSRKVIRRKIAENADRSELVKELENSLRYKRFSIICLLLFILAFVTIMILKAFGFTQ